MEAVAHKTPALKQQRDRAQKRGFSLIETAFVLAVVGGVIGAIWYSAAKFYEDYKVNKTVEDLQLIFKNIQNLISFRDAEAIGDGINITAFLVQADAIPKDWMNGNIVKSPYSENGSVLGIWNRPTYFEVWDNKLSRDVCIKAVVRISTFAASAGRLEIGGHSRPSLGRIYVNGAGNFGTSIFPVSLEQAETACNQSINNVAFYFGYTRNN